MGVFDIDFSRFAIYLYVSVAVGLFLGFRLLEYVIPLFKLRKRASLIVQRFLPSFEILLWIGFLIFGIQFFIKRGQIFGLAFFAILLMLLFFASWLGLKEYIAGALFKASGSFQKNELIKVGEFSGRIKQFNSRSLELTKETGETIYLPYSQLLSGAVAKLHPAEMVLSHSFSIKVLDSKNPERKKEPIRFFILNLPWSSINKEPQIKLVETAEDYTVFEITAYSSEREYFFLIEKALIENFSA